MLFLRRAYYLDCQELGDRALTKRTIIATLALATVAAPSIALAGPMNLADPVLVPTQASTTWHDSTTTWQSNEFQKHHRIHQMIHAGRAIGRGKP
jgi:hypothetical protein